MNYFNETFFLVIISDLLYHIEIFDYMPTTIFFFFFLRMNFTTEIQKHAYRMALMHGPLGSRQLGTQTKGARMEDYTIKGVIWYLAVRALSFTMGAISKWKTVLVQDFFFRILAVVLQEDERSESNFSLMTTQLAELQLWLNMGSKDDLPMQPGKDIFQLLQVKHL